MSKNILHKSEIIYSRLFQEYNDWENKDEFMAEFGLGRQSFYERKKKKTVDYDEIIDIFPEVNRKWLFSSDKEGLEKLPVRNDQTKLKSNLTHKFRLLEQKISDEGVDYDAQKELLEFLEDRTESLSQELAEISVMMKRLRLSMRRNRSH
jgi:hypothetical protein